MAAATSAADAMTMLLSQKNNSHAPPPALTVAPAVAEPAAAPPQGGRFSCAPDLVRRPDHPDPHRQLCYAGRTGARHGRSRQCRRNRVAARLDNRSNPAFSRPPVWCVAESRDVAWMNRFGSEPALRENASPGRSGGSGSHHATGQNLCAEASRGRMCPASFILWGLHPAGRRRGTEPGPARLRNTAQWQSKQNSTQMNTDEHR